MMPELSCIIVWAESTSGRHTLRERERGRERHKMKRKGGVKKRERGMEPAV